MCRRAMRGTGSSSAAYHTITKKPASLSRRGRGRGRGSRFRCAQSRIQCLTTCRTCKFTRHTTTLPNALILIAHNSSTFVMGSVTVAIGDVEVPARVEIETDGTVIIRFKYFNWPHAFDIVEWSGRGFANLCDLFFSHEPRDCDKFGQHNGPPFTAQQRRNIVFQASVDFLACLDKIVKAHPREVIDYAMWYAPRHREKATTSYSA